MLKYPNRESGREPRSGVEPSRLYPSGGLSIQLYPYATVAIGERRRSCSWSIVEKTFTKPFREADWSVLLLCREQPTGEVLRFTAQPCLHELERTAIYRSRNANLSLLINLSDRECFLTYRFFATFPETESPNLIFHRFKAKNYPLSLP